MRSVLTLCCSLAAAVGMAGSACAADFHWTGTAGDGKWTTPTNWDLGSPPTSAADGTFLSPVASLPITVAIDAGETVDVGLGTSFGTIFGPEWGSTLNIAGTLNYKWYLAPIGAAGNPSNINMTGNAHLSGEGIGLGYNWWFNGAPYVNFNMYDNSSVNINFLFFGGHLNLTGGTFTTGGVLADNSDQVSDLTRRMDITGGKFVLTNGDQTALIQNWIGRGILVGYGGSGSIAIDTTSVPGQTIVTAVVPEPAMLGIFAITAPLVLRRRK